MELSKKTTILFRPEMHERLVQLAAFRGMSLGDLVRRACEREYAISSREERLAAVDDLADLRLPVGTPTEMALESVPDPEGLMP